MHRLEMPDTSAGSCVESQQRVGEEILAHPGAAVEIRSRGSGRDVHDAAPDIDAHACPRIRTAGSLPGIRRPRVITQLAWAGNGVKRPADFAGTDVIGANISRRGSFLLADARSLDENVLVNDTRAGRHDVSVTDVAPQPRREIHPA